MNPISVTRQPAVFRTTPDVLKENNKLLRLVTLDASLPKVARTRMLGRVNEFCTTAIEKNLTSPEDAKKHLDAQLPSFVKNIYGPEIDMAKTSDEVNKCIHRLMKDINSAIAAPLVKSTDGQNGPTFLVAYPHFNKKTSETEIKSYVMKWTDRNELCSNRIYDVFSRFILEHCNSSSFAIPRVCGFDFERSTHEMFDTTRFVMQGDESQKMMDTFNAIAKIGAPKHPMPHKLVMLSERVNGENLCDFVMVKYQFLTQDQKMKLLAQLGQIAMLDLILGNSDRLVPIWKNPQDNHAYSLLGSEANLGNIMVQWTADQEKAPLIYAIDNAVEVELIKDPASIQKHQEFLQSLFSNPEVASILSKYIAGSVLSAISLHVDDAKPEKIKKYKEQLIAISQDIEMFGKDCFQNGINEMSSMLQSTLIPMWNGEQGVSSRNYLSTTYPELFDAIQSRFNEFTTKRIL